MLAANPHTIVVLKSGGPVLLPWVDQAPAILEAWYPGEEDGAAVAAVLFGEVNPSGKLPITFPKRDEDLPPTTADQYPGVQNVAHIRKDCWWDTAGTMPKTLNRCLPSATAFRYTTFAYRI